MLVVIGGIIPDVDIPKLKDVGVKGIFLPGTPMQDIIDFISANVAHRAWSRSEMAVTTLLLADDSVTIQRVIELTFADEDIQVVGGRRRQARRSPPSRRDRPDIVLADVGMPERDGYEVAAFIKTNAELAHIPVVLLTGAFEPIDEARARAVGCDGVLVKPFEPQIVISRVKDLLAGRSSAGLWSTAAGTVRRRSRRLRRRSPRRRSLRRRRPDRSRTTSIGSMRRLQAWRGLRHRRRQPRRSRRAGCCATTAY